jgi:hypothetical protein
VGGVYFPGATMWILSRKSAGVFAAVGLAVGCSSAAAAVLYDNGALNGNIYGFNIGVGAGVADTFNLAGSSTVDSIQFGTWTFPGDTVVSVNWGIVAYSGPSTDPFNSAFIDSGTASVSNGSTTPNLTGWATGVDSFSTGSISLPGGVYYLVLQNATTTGGNPVLWDESDGLSAAVEEFVGSLAGFNGSVTGSESFQVLGSSGGSGGGGVPEPGSWALMLLGFGAVGAALRGAGGVAFRNAGRQPTRSLIA